MWWKSNFILPLEIWSAQISEGKMRIYLEREWFKYQVTWIFLDEPHPNFPKDTWNANFIAFTIKNRRINISGMKVREKLRWDGIIDILFNTINKIWEVIHVQSIETSKIKKPSTSKKLTRWGFSAIDKNPIVWVMAWLSNSWVPQVELYKPSPKKDVIMRNYSNWWEHHFYDIVNYLKDIPKYESFPLQEKMFLDNSIVLEQLLNWITWKYRSSKTAIKRVLL